MTIARTFRILSFSLLLGFLYESFLYNNFEFRFRFAPAPGKPLRSIRTQKADVTPPKGFVQPPAVSYQSLVRSKIQSYPVVWSEVSYARRTGNRIDPQNAMLHSIMKRGSKCLAFSLPHRCIRLSHAGPVILIHGCRQLLWKMPLVQDSAFSDHFLYPPVHLLTPQ